MTAQGCLKPLAYTLGGLVVLAVGFYLMIVVASPTPSGAQTATTSATRSRRPRAATIAEAFRAERQDAPGELAWPDHWCRRADL